MRRTALITSITCVLLLVLLLPLTASAVANWAPNTAYSIGSLVMFNGVEYKCIQAHTSEIGWEPPNVPALWQPVSGNPGPTPTPTPKPTPTPPPPPPPPPTGHRLFAPYIDMSLSNNNLPAISHALPSRVMAPGCFLTAAVRRYCTALAGSRRVPHPNS